MFQVVEDSFQTSQLQHTPTRKRPSKNEPQPDCDETKRTKLLSMACERLEKLPSDAQIIAKGWGVEYEKMSANQQLYAKKFIDDILFEGRLGNLHRHSITVNNPPQSFATSNQPQYIQPPGYIPCSHARSAPSTSFNSYPSVPSPSNISTHSDSS